MHLLGFRFAPRIRDLGDTMLYVPKGDTAYDALKPMIGDTLNIRHVRAHWDEILRLATSIKQDTVTAAIVLWNTVYLERTSRTLRSHSQTIDDALLQYLSPLGWEHINLTGIASGAAAPSRCDHYHRLNVLYFPLSETPPLEPCTLRVQVKIFCPFKTIIH